MKEKAKSEDSEYEIIEEDEESEEENEADQIKNDSPNKIVKEVAQSNNQTVIKPTNTDQTDDLDFDSKQRVDTESDHEKAQEGVDEPRKPNFGDKAESPSKNRQTKTKTKAKEEAAKENIKPQAESATDESNPKTENKKHKSETPKNEFKVDKTNAIEGLNIETEENSMPKGKLIFLLVNL